MMMPTIKPNENSQNKYLIIFFTAPFSNHVINLSTIIKYVLKNDKIKKYVI